MGVILKNNAVSTITTAISASDVGLAVAAGTGTLFPTLGASDYFYATLVSAGGTYEVIKVTARVGDTMTIVRAQEGTTAQSFASGSRIEVRVTAASITDMIAEHDQASEITFTPTGGISATNVQSAIAEVDSESAKAATLAGSGGAALIGNAPSGTVSATTVQGAINEIVSDLASSTGASLVGFLQSGVGAVARTVQAKLSETVSVKDFGAVGDGITDDKNAFDLADALNVQIHVPAGDYLIGSSVTLSSQITFDAGAKLLIGNGVTVAFTGQVVSGPYQIFQCTGTGAVTFNEAKTAEGYPEWWGAVVNDNGAAASANRTAINACITALPRTKLQPADYWIDDYIHLAISHRELIGQGYPYDGATADVVSRIVVNNGTTDAIRVGPNTKPATVNQFPQGLRVMNVTTDRSVAPVVSSDCTGIRVQYVLNAQFENVMARQCIYGWRFNGAVYSKVRDCQSFRSVAGTGGADKYYGFFVDGSINIGLAGGNASLYLEGCNSSMGGLSFADSNGLYANLAFTDLFVYEFETVRHSIGINIQGNASTTSPYSNLDLQIRNPVIDAYELYGIFFNNVNESGACEVIGGYTAPLTGGTASCGILISSCKGSVAIHGTQMIMAQSAATNGVVIENSANAVIDRTQILECRGTPMTVDNSVSCDVRPVIKNYYEVTVNAVQIAGATAGCFIQPLINGDANFYSRGINVAGTADVRNEYNCTLINSSCLNGGSAKKLVRNGVDITATGLSGTNLVSGVMT